MSDYIEITGGVPLKGSIQVSGAKNAVLPLMIASLLTSEPCRFTNVPNLLDVSFLLRLLEHLGSETSFQGDTAGTCTPCITSTEASYSLVKALRASFWILAPLLARTGHAHVALPGGDIIGARPVDIHLEGLSRMGADIKVRHGVVDVAAPSGLRPAKISLRFPSVGATHQLLMAMALTRGTSIIEGAAREPEVIALSEMLKSMGAGIDGIGTSTLEVRGRSDLGGACVKIIGDRIEAGTFLLAAAVTRGEVDIEGINPAHLGAFREAALECGVAIEEKTDGVRVRAPEPLRAVRIATSPFPGFATDMQAPFMAALCTAEGQSVIEEHVFEGRFGHVSELCRMGAAIKVEETTASVTGVRRLTGAPVEGLDIRAAAALVVAALGAEGITEIHEAHHLRRGYEALEDKLRGLGARICCKVSDPEDFMLTGC